jgi:hypothetical protein
VAPPIIPRLVLTTFAILTAAGCSQHSSTAARAPFADGSDTAVSTAIDAITTFPTQLDQRLWNGMELKPDVRQRSLEIVDDIVRNSGIPGLTVDSVELFGSDASYEYDDTSDFGIHVFTHSSLPSAQLEPLLRLLNDDVERRQEGHITFNGVVVEVTFHGRRTDNYRPTPGMGQYSLSEDRWIERPTTQPSNFDRAQMALDVKRFVGDYNDLVAGYTADPKGFDCARFGALDKSLKDYRNDGLVNGFGSRSTPNLAYRALRRLNVSIPAMLDTLEDQCNFAQESIG